jgi:RNA polymerase primary sigma factor
MLNEIYFNDLSKIKTLSHEQTKELATKIKTGDKQALDKLITANLKLVVYFAKQYRKELQGNNIIELDDLVSEGNLGLIQAAQRYQPEMDVKFSYYASYWITKMIKEYIITNVSDIRTPSNKISSDNKIRKAIEEIYKDEKEAVTADQLKDLGTFTDGEIFHFFNKIHVVSIEDKFNLPDLNDLQEEQELQYEQKEQIKKGFKYLKEKEVQIIKWYYGIDCDAIDDVKISNLLNLSRQRVGQLRNRALTKMKSHIKL